MKHSLRTLLALALAGMGQPAISDPFDCGEANIVTIDNTALNGVDYLSCRANDELRLGPSLSLGADAELDGGAAVIRFTGPFSLTPGAEMSVGNPPCAGLLTFEDGKQPNSEINVAVAGTNAPGCGALGTPCATIAYAAGLATPGTAVRVWPGTHAADQSISNLAGTAENPIWIGGAPGQDIPVIDGGSQGLHLIKARYVIVHDLAVTNSSANGINADDGGQYDDPDAARYLIFRSLLIQDIGNGGNQDCLKLSGIDDFWVYDNEFDNCSGGGSGVDMVGCHNGIIQGNWFHTGDSNGVQSKGGSEDVAIHANLFQLGGDRALNLGGSTGGSFFRPSLDELSLNAEARNIRAVGNVISGSTAAIAFAGCVDCLAANNTIDTPTRRAFRILQETVSIGDFDFEATKNGRVYNNIVYFDDQMTTAFNIGPDTAPETFDLQSNLWYRYDMPLQSSPPGGGTPVVDPGQLEGMNPDFDNPGAGDFHIDNLSPAYQSGTALPEIQADFDFACYAAIPSRGAFEVN